MCTHPLEMWIVVDYSAVFMFRILMFVDNGLAAGMAPETGQEVTAIRFRARLVVLSLLGFLLYPFLWVWTVIGSMWFTKTQACLPEEGQKWGFLIWLVFSYSGLICIACISAGKWLLRRQSYLQLIASRPAPVSLSEFQVLLELIRAPDWASRSTTTTQEMPGHHNGRDITSYHPGLHFTPSQRERVERAIQQLPKFRLKSVVNQFSACPICLDEFEVDTEVRGLPCAHNFHSACIDEWLRLSVQCPHCRCSVFPDLDFSEAPLPGQATPNLRRQRPTREANDNRAMIVIVPSTNRMIRAQPAVGQSNLRHLQDLLQSSQINNFHPSASLPALPQRQELSRSPQAEELEREVSGNMPESNSAVPRDSSTEGETRVSVSSLDDLAIDTVVDGGRTSLERSRVHNARDFLPDSTSVVIESSLPDRL
jgi:E3 ubiquitin-protein ligase SIS3